MLTKISTHSYFADDGSVPNYVDAAIFSIPGYSKHSCQRLTFNGSDEDTSCASFVQRLSGYNLSDNKIEDGGAEKDDHHTGDEHADVVTKGPATNSQGVERC